MQIRSFDTDGFKVGASSNAIYINGGTTSIGSLAMESQWWYDTQVIQMEHTTSTVQVNQMQDLA